MRTIVSGEQNTENRPDLLLRNHRYYPQKGGRLRMLQIPDAPWIRDAEINGYPYYHDEEDDE